MASFASSATMGGARKHACMPKYWGKQIFSPGSFPKVGEKKKKWPASLMTATKGGARKPPNQKTFCRVGIMFLLEFVSEFCVCIKFEIVNSSQQQLHYILTNCQGLEINSDRECINKQNVRRNLYERGLPLGSSSDLRIHTHTVHNPP